MHCFSSRVTSWLTRTLRVGGFVLRRHIGASVIRPLHLGWPTQQQRPAQEAVAVLGSQTIPWDRHRQIERKFCTIVGGVTTPPCGVPLVRSSRVPFGCSTGARSHRPTYSFTQARSVWWATARSIRSRGMDSNEDVG